MKYLIQICAIALISLIFLYDGIGQTNMENHNTIRLSVGRYYAALLDSRNFYGAGAYTRKLGKFEVGAQAGFRYEAYHFVHIVRGDETVNVIGKSDGFKTQYPFGHVVFLTTDIGDIHPEFKATRYFQTFFHLFLERNFKLFDNFYASLALGPSIEYGDIVFPAHVQDALISGPYGEDLEVRLYDFLLHRYIAFGWMGAGRLKYDFGKVGLAIGFEYSHYPDGNRIKSPFLEVIVPF